MKVFAFLDGTVHRLVQLFYDIPTTPYFFQLVGKVGIRTELYGCYGATHENHKGG